MSKNSSPLVLHNANFRRTWMFPRNIRRIYPWKIAQITSLLIEQLQNVSWVGNKTIQTSFTKALEASGLKTPGTQYDINSGGARTYLAQLKCLGIMFQRTDGTIWLTMAGEDLVNGRPPLPIMQKLILRHQYPSAYSAMRNIKIHPAIKIKPFQFVCKFLLDTDIGFLSLDELVIIIVYGHNDNCYNICKSKILKFRKGQPLISLINNKNDDLYTPRTQDRSFENALKDVFDIANTCKNYLQGVCIIEEIDKDNKKVYVLSQEIKQTVIQELLENESYIDVNSEESFQRSYGTLEKIKDTRQLITSKSNKVSDGSHIIVAEFMKHCGQNLLVESSDEFVNATAKNFGFSKDLILKTIQPFLESSLSIYESTYLDISKGGQKSAIQFEKATCSLFRDVLLFDARHTGQKVKKGGVGAFADIFIIALDKKHCAIIDAKASPRYYLSSDDYHKMVGNYIPNYMQLSDGRKLILEFCTYVAGGFHGEINKKLKEIECQTSIPASAISSFDLLNICKHKFAKSDQPKIRKWFSESKILTATNKSKAFN
ncbi:MAG: hypothetical protein WCW35_13055 [Bacteroidota bacterium]